ncbi:MAG: class I SAM-dependent methyltransferase, partial [Pedobacter sp.]
ELGCGSGSHAMYLSKEGFQITGIERSPEMVDIARKKNIQGFEPIVGNIEDFSLDKRFDSVISLFHVISYLTTNDALLKCFKQVNRHLKQGGIFLFDTWFTPAVYTQIPDTRIRRLEDDGIEVVRIAESTMDYFNNIVNVNFEVLIKDKQNGRSETIKEVHPMRHFSIGEISFLALHCGFEVILEEEFLSGAKPGKDTWGVCFVLKKIKDHE